MKQKRIFFLSSPDTYFIGDDLLCQRVSGETFFFFKTDFSKIHFHSTIVCVTVISKERERERKTKENNP